MGTRSITHIFNDDDDQPIVTIYRQFDGYPTGMGDDLAKILTGHTLVNGYGNKTEPVFNGMGCLAARVIAALKPPKPGNIYVYPAGSEDCGEEYVYEIRPAGLGNPVRLVGRCAGDEKAFYDGPPAGFNGADLEEKLEKEEQLP